MAISYHIILSCQIERQLAATAPLHRADRSGESIAIDAQFIEDDIGDLARNADLSRFIL